MSTKLTVRQVQDLSSLYVDLSAAIHRVIMEYACIIEPPLAIVIHAHKTEPRYTVSIFAEDDRFSVLGRIVTSMTNDFDAPISRADMCHQIAERYIHDMRYERRRKTKTGEQ